MMIHSCPPLRIAVVTIAAAVGIAAGHAGAQEDAAPAPAAAQVATATLDEVRKTVRVEIGGSLFTELIYAGQPKPVLFPVVGPGGFQMTRQWPI
ncbi:MAG: hypothetical protein EOP86_23955, partial [Verrucomicrobiaceae bacterium]